MFLELPPPTRAWYKTIPSTLATLKAGEKGNCLTSTICPLHIVKASAILLAGEWAHWQDWRRCAFCPSSSLRSVPPGVVEDWLLCSPNLGDKHKLWSTVQRSCGWPVENIWKRKRLPTNRQRITHCIHHFKYRKKKGGHPCSKGPLCYKDHALYLCANNNSIWQNKF